MFNKIREQAKSDIENGIYNKIINSILEESIENYFENIKFLNKSNEKEYSKLQLMETLNLLEDFTACNYNINNLETFKNSFDLSIFKFTKVDLDNKMQLDLITTADTLISDQFQKHFNVLNNITEDTFSGIEEKEVQESIENEITRLNRELEISLKLIQNVFNNRILKILKDSKNPLYKELMNKASIIYKDNYRQLETVFSFTKSLSFDKIKNKESLIILIQNFKALNGILKTFVLLFYSLKLYLSGLENNLTIGDLYNFPKYNNKYQTDNNNYFMISYLNNNNIIKSESNNSDVALINFLNSNNKNNINSNIFFNYFYDIASPEIKNAFQWIKNENIDNKKFNMVLKQSKMSVTYFHNFDAVFNSGYNLLKSFNKLLNTTLEQPFEVKINNEKLNMMGSEFELFSGSISELESDILSFKINNI